MALPETFDAYVPSSIPEFFALANLKPGYISLASLRSIPLRPEHQLAYDYAEKIVAPGAFIHSVRSYYFALAILHNGFPSKTPGVPQISFKDLQNRLFYACILHDLGLTVHPEALAHPAHAMSFELHGGIMAYEHLHNVDPTLSAEDVGDIVQGIMVHTISFQSGRSSAVGTLVQVAAGFDIMGKHAFGPDPLDFLVNEKTILEIEKEYPRGELGIEVKNILVREFDNKPNCLLSHGPHNFIELISATKSLVGNK